MSFGENATAKGAMAFGFFSDDKKCCPGLVAGEEVEHLRGVTRIGSVVNGEANLSFRGGKAGDDFSVPVTIPTEGRIEPKKIMYQPGGEAGPPPEGQRAGGGGEASGCQEVSLSESHFFRSFQTRIKRGSNNRHNLVWVPTSNKLSRR